MTDLGSNGSDWRQPIVGYFGRRTAGVQPLAFDDVIRRSELGRSDQPPLREASRRGTFLALVAVILVLLGVGTVLTSGWRPGNGGDDVVVAADEDEAPATTEDTTSQDPASTPTSEDADDSTGAVAESEGETADAEVAGSNDDPAEPDGTPGEPLLSFVVLRDVSGAVERVSVESGETRETIGIFPALAANNRSPDSLVEGRVRSVVPDGLGTEGQAGDVLLAVCCEPVGGNVYRLSPSNPDSGEQPVAVGTRAVPTPDGSVTVYAITAYDFVVDGIELGVELDGMVDVAWINRSGMEGLAWLDVDEARPEGGVLKTAIYDRGSSSVSDVAEIADIELRRRSMASDGFDRLIVAGCLDVACGTTQVRWIRPTDGTTVAETVLDYGAMVTGVDPSGRILLVADNGEVHLLEGFGEADDVTDQVVASGALWAGW